MKKQNPFLFLAIGVAVGYLLANQSKTVLPLPTTEGDPLIGKPIRKNQNILIAL